MGENERACEQRGLVRRDVDGSGFATTPRSDERSLDRRRDLRRGAPSRALRPRCPDVHADAGLSHDVTSIASVSGGGITNGFVAQECAFDDIDGEDLEFAMKPLAMRIASQTVWWYWLTGLWALALVAVVVGLVAIWTIDLITWLQVAGFVFGIAMFGWVSALRSAVCERSMRTRLYNQDGSTTKLADLAHRNVEHVFCATDLHAGEHVYFSPRFVCAYRYGWGSPGDP